MNAACCRVARFAPRRVDEIWNVAHIEAGLRGFELGHPLPEELDHRLTSGLATLHYAPGAWAASNLRRDTVVDTGSNTIRDGLRPAEELGAKLPAGRKTAVLSGCDLGVLRTVLGDRDRHRRRHTLPPASPSLLIVDDLVRRGCAAASEPSAAAGG
jgi:hypothetical protein